MRRGGNWRTILIDKQNIQQALTDNSMTPCLSRPSVEFTANVLACLPLFLLTWENQKPLRLDFHPLSECGFCHPPGQRNAGTRTLKPLGPRVITVNSAITVGWRRASLVDAVKSVYLFVWWQVSEPEARISWVDQYDSALRQCSHAYW